MKRFLTVFLLVVFSAVFAFAQGTTGRLSGTISGPDGALPGATVTATDTTTGKELTVTTNEEGYYSFPQLEFGTYTIRVTATGFKTLVANEQKIDVGREATLSPVLEIGDVSAEVVVTAGADIVTSTTAQVSNTVSPQQILSLPLITRNPLSLTNLQAGVSANTAQLTTINGMRTTFTNITRDGINIQDTFIRANATDFAPGRPSVDDTGEFTITTSNQEADQGYGGAQIRLVTPRGTKDFHGALFAYNRNSAFGANSFFNNRTGAAKPFRNRNQFGGKASWRLPVPGFGEGVPAWYMDKAFFFFAYEGIRDPVTAAANRTILSPAARAGTFTYNRATAGSAINTTINGANVNCPAAAGSVCTITNFLQYAQSIFPTGNIRSTISPTIQNLILAGMPTASNFTGGDGLNTQGFRLNRGSDQTRDQYSTRFDVDFDDSNTINIIYNLNDELNLRPDVDTSGFNPAPDVDQTSKNKQFTAAYRRVFSSNFINEVRGGFFGSEVPFNRLSPTGDYILSVPFLTATTQFTTTPLQFLNQGRNTKAFNIQDNADWIMGDHTIRFGGQAQIFRVNAYNDAQIFPVVQLASGATEAGVINTTLATSNFTSVGGISSTQLAAANSLLALLGGQYTTVTQGFNKPDLGTPFQRLATEFRAFRYENHALYVADRWQAARGLTVNVGVRYEIFPALRNNTGNALEPVIGDDVIGSLLDPAGLYQPIGGNAGRRNAYYKTDWNNFAPSLGVAWTPNFGSGIGRFLFGENKTVIRGGYSQVYGNDSIVTSINNAAVGNAGLGRSVVTPPARNLRLDTTPPPVVATFPEPSFPRAYLANNAPGIGNFFGTVFAVDPKLKTPRVDQYSVGIQREIWGDMAFELRYVGSRSDNLARGVDLGQIDMVNNGFLPDFLRAQNNLRVNETERQARIAACIAGGGTSTTCTATVNASLPASAGFNPALPGSVQLTVIPLIGATSGTNGGIGSPTVLINPTVQGHLNNGTPADLAIFYINSATNLNNQPCVAPAPTICSPTATPRVRFLPNNSTGVIDLFLNDAKYKYDSLQAEVRKRFSNGLYFTANYTFSKNLTNAVGTTQALFEPYLDNGRQELDDQRADFDTTHVFNASGIYQLPFGQGKRFLNYSGIADKILGGWELSGLVQWFSGAPITFVDTRGTFNRTARSARQTAFSNLTNDEIRALGGVFEENGNIYFINPNVLLQTRNPATGVWSSTASTGYNINGLGAFAGQAFFNVQPGQTGNVTRALVNGPSFFNLNMALLKNIKFTESMRLQLRMEAFNVFNNVNFNISDAQQRSNINSTTFGQLTTTANAARELQFAARFEF